MITSGMVKVNGKVVTNLGVKVDPARDKVQVGGEMVFLTSRLVYILIYKPRGYITTLSDEKGRKKVTDLLKNVTERIYPVGRLDYDSEGLLLLTNDGDLTYALTHPKHQVSKTYLVRVKGVPTQKMLHKLANNMVLGDGPVAPALVKMLDEQKNALLEITVYEGRNRLVRRMCTSIGHPVLRLKRIKIANLSLKGLRPGRYRYLTGDEVKRLKQLAGLQP
jgi:23S rRNA pseudouridine2605 synthase/16S rRNA pseudouridine516 synthase